MRRLLMKTGWCVLFFFALLNSILAMRDLLPRVPFPSQLPNFTLHRIALTGHASCAGIALLAGSAADIGERSIFHPKIPGLSHPAL